MPVNILITPLPWLDHDVAMTGSMFFIGYSAYKFIRLPWECKLGVLFGVGLSHVVVAVSPDGKKCRQGKGPRRQVASVEIGFAAIRRHEYPRGEWADGAAACRLH
jgi:hypothetical protein